MNVQEKLNLVKRNLKETTGEDIIKCCLEKNEAVNVYWGTAPTGKPHIAYFLPMTKLADFLKAGCQVSILFADLHAYLDNMKAPWELLDKRTEYYEILIKGILKALSVPLDKLRFIKGTTFQLEENYTKAVYQIVSLTSVRDGIKAGCEVVKQVDDPLLSGIVYPLLQSLDEEFLGVDAQFGGNDQRKIFMFAEKYLPYMSYSKRAHLMNAIIPGLTGGKMSASDEHSKIDLLDTEEIMKKKIESAECKGITKEDNALLAFLEYIALPNKAQHNNDFLNKYESIKDIELDFKEGKLTEKDLKDAVIKIQWSLMKNLRGEFTLANKDKLIEEAYPRVVAEKDENKDDGYNLLMADFHEELKALKEEFKEIPDSFPPVMDRPSIMWSCRSSGEPHIGYLIPLRKLALLSQKNWKVIILIEDIGAYLHSKHLSNKPTWDQLPERSQLYKELFRNAFELFGGKMDNLNIVIGSEFQLSKKYAMMLYQSLSKVTEKECHEIVDKLTGDTTDKSTRLSRVMYPCISVLDQLYLRPTVRLFGTRFCADNVALFERNLSNKVGLSHIIPAYVHHEMLMTLEGRGIMSCPIIFAKTAPMDLTSISLCDGLDTISEKMAKVFLNSKVLNRDPTLNIIELIIWPRLKEGIFKVKRNAENGGDIAFKSLLGIKEELIVDHVHPSDIKVAVSHHLFDLIISPIHQRLSENCLSLFMATFSETTQNIKIDSPNNIDLRVAVVEKIKEQSGSHHFVLKSGLDRFTMIKNNLCQLSPSDHCLVAINASSIDPSQQVVGVVTRANDGVAVKLSKRPYNVVVSFKNYDIVSPHSKESNVEVIVKMISENIVIKKDHLEWMKDGSMANELIIAARSDGGDVNVTVDCS